jgi:hypothetical protein
MHGSGTMDKDATKIQATWNHGRLHGRGSITHANKTYSVTWNHGTLIYDQRKGARSDLQHSNYSWVNMLLVGAAVGIAGVSLCVKEDELKKALRFGGAALWGFNIIETLCGSSFSYLGNAKNTDQAQHTMHRMRKMSPEIHQTIRNYHYEVVEQPAKKQEQPAK